MALYHLIIWFDWCLAFQMMMVEFQTIETLLREASNVQWIYISLRIEWEREKISPVLFIPFITFYVIRAHLQGISFIWRIKRIHPKLVLNNWKMHLNISHKLQFIVMHKHYWFTINHQDFVEVIYTPF